MNKDNVNSFSKGDFFFEKAVSSGNMPASHAHTSYEIFYLTSGTRKYFINNKYYLIKAGDIVCIPLNAPHKTGGASGQRFLINFSQQFVDNYLTKNGQSVLLGFFEKLFLRPPADLQNAVLDIFNKIQDAYSKTNTENIVRNLFKLFTVLNDCPPLQNENTYAIKQLHKVMQYVQTNYEHISGLNDVAKALFISKYYICHLFSKYLEIPFMQYLTQTRLKMATQLLEKTNLSVSEISAKCGFNSSAYFGMVFKKEFNVTALHYRKLHQQTEL